MGEAYLETSTTHIVVLDDRQGALGEGELCPAVGAELVMEDEWGGLNQGASGTRSVGTQTEGTGPVTHLALDLVVAHSAVNLRVVGAEVRYLPSGASLGAPRGTRTAQQELLPYCPFRPAQCACR